MLNYNRSRSLVLRSLVVSLVLSALVSCSGGGGGGGESEESSSRGIRILHGAIDSAPAELTVDTVEGVLQSASFGDSKGYVRIPPGPRTVTVTTRGLYGQRFTQSLTVSDDDRRTALLVEGTQDDDYRLTVLNDLPPPSPDGRPLVRVINALRKAGDLSVVIGDLDPVVVSEGGASLYVPSTAGTKSVVAHAEDTRRVYSGTASLESNQAYTIFITGEDEYFVIARVIRD